MNHYKSIEPLPLSVIEAARAVTLKPWNEYCDTMRAT